MARRARPVHQIKHDGHWRRPIGHMSKFLGAALAPKLAISELLAPGRSKSRPIGFQVIEIAQHLNWRIG
jgi:hypothetical protein